MSRQAIMTDIRDSVLESLGLCYLTLGYLDDRYRLDLQFRDNVNKGLEMSVQAVYKVFDSKGYPDQIPKQRGQPSKVCCQVKGLWDLYEALGEFTDADIVERRALEETLDSIGERTGLLPAAEVGMEFDHNYHLAVQMSPGEKNTIVAVLHPGFKTQKGKLLIEARVYVGNGVK